MKNLNFSKSLLLAITLLIFTITFQLPLLGASNQATATVNVNLEPFQSLSTSDSPSLSKIVTTTYKVTSITDVDVNRSYIERREAITLVIRSNTDWRLNVEALNSNMGDSFNGVYVKPIEDFSCE